jgi:hypothetical protein
MEPSTPSPGRRAAPSLPPAPLWWAILTPMRSVADDLREELQEEVLRLPFEERMALAMRLGERGLEMFRQASGLDRETALRELQRQRQAGRTPSKCMSELIG